MQTFNFVGGDASLNLVNTLFHRDQPGGPGDQLSEPGAALRWFVEAGLLSHAEADQVDQDTVQISARRLRTALDAIYRPLALDKVDLHGASRGLSVLNAVLDQGRERIQLHVASSSSGFARATRFEVIGPFDPTVLVARAAAELLHRLESRRLKECENPECDLLFYDESRNASRRWCSMEGCGNQQKQVRFRHRHAAV